MHRRIAPLLLAVLVAFPFVAPASAAEPSVPVVGEPGPTPTPEVAPTPEPTATPNPTPSDPGEPLASEPVADPLTGAATAITAPDPAAAVTPDASATRPDATGRYIVMLRGGSDTAAVVAKGHKRDGLKADRSFNRTFRGFSAKLDKRQKTDLLADPNVLAVVPDEVIQLTQTTPTGIARVGGGLSDVVDLDGTDQRVDADVAIVDTGIALHPDLNVAGGYNCSTADHTLWRDKEHHGTHVAGTVGALDNSFGVVGIAPGVRLWAVKILNDDGYGLISWYICGLDWILAQRDPNDANRPLFEAVNMSVTKAGSDDHNCGLTNKDALHQAICRVVAGGITVVAAAANDHHNAAKNIPASYDEVITVSALADTDGKAGGLGGNRCFSWGGYDKDDTFADFSNYGADIDIMAPGKCILSTVPGPGYAYLSGTSMSAPTVTGAVALYKSSRPNATPAEVREALRYLGNLNWKTSTDPDSVHEPLLDVSRIGDLGTFSLERSGTTPTVEPGTTGTVRFTIDRSPTFFERVGIEITSLPDGWTAAKPPASVMGWTANTGAVSLVIPPGTPLGRYDVGVKGTNEGRTDTLTVSVNVVEDNPTAYSPMAGLVAGTQLGRTSVPVHLAWPAATDPSSAITGYQVQSSKNGGGWSATRSFSGTTLSTSFTASLAASYRFRIRAIDSAGHWSPWTQSAAPFHVFAVDDRSSAVATRGSWARVGGSSAYKSTVTGASKANKTISMTFNGRGVAVVAPRSATRGKVKVYIDGVYIKTLNLRSKTTLSRQVVFSRYFAGGGWHKVTLMVVGTGKYKLFRLDAFLVAT